MEANTILRLRTKPHGDRYGIECVWSPSKKYYELFVILRPGHPQDRDAAYHPLMMPVGPTTPSSIEGHVSCRAMLSVRCGWEPRTLDRAKAIAYRWAYGFSEYRRTGVFPNNAVRVDV